MSRPILDLPPGAFAQHFHDVVGEHQKPLVAALFGFGELTPLLRGAVQQRGHPGVGGDRIAHVTTGASVMIVLSWRHWTAYWNSSLSWDASPRKSMRALPRCRQCVM